MFSLLIFISSSISPIEQIKLKGFTDGYNKNLNIPSSIPSYVKPTSLPGYYILDGSRLEKEQVLPKIQSIYLNSYSHGIANSNSIPDFNINNELDYLNSENKNLDMIVNSLTSILSDIIVRIEEIEQINNIKYTALNKDKLKIIQMYMLSKSEKKRSDLFNSNPPNYDNNYDINNILRPLPF